MAGGGLPALAGLRARYGRTASPRCARTRTRAVLAGTASARRRPYFAASHTPEACQPDGASWRCPSYCPPCPATPLF